MGLVCLLVFFPWKGTSCSRCWAVDKLSSELKDKSDRRKCFTLSPQLRVGVPRKWCDSPCIPHPFLHCCQRQVKGMTLFGGQNAWTLKTEIQHNFRYLRVEFFFSSPSSNFSLCLPFFHPPQLPLSIAPSPVPLSWKHTSHFLTWYPMIGLGLWLQTSQLSSEWKVA